MPDADETMYYVVDHLGYIISAHETFREAHIARLRYHNANDYDIEEVQKACYLWETPKRQRA